MKFVLVDEGVVSVELSLGAIFRIANAFDTHIDTSNLHRDGEGLTEQDKALGNAFKNAYLKFQQDENTSTEEESVIEVTE